MPPTDPYPPADEGAEAAAARAWAEAHEAPPAPAPERDAVVASWGAPPVAPVGAGAPVLEQAPGPRGTVHPAAGARRVALVVAVGGTLGLVGGFALAAGREPSTTVTPAGTTATTAPLIPSQEDPGAFGSDDRRGPSTQDGANGVTPALPGSSGGGPMSSSAGS